MSKGLEALKEFKSEFRPGVNVYANEYLDIIEKELKEYDGAKNHIEALHKERVENSLKLKALDIIKNKKVDTVMFFWNVSLRDYNNIHSRKEKLTQEEYNLLKEVLL